MTNIISVFICREDYQNAINPNEPNYIGDLGLGKETRFKYPWNPSSSPEICKLAQNQLGSTTGKVYWDYAGNYPGQDCNQFIYSKMYLAVLISIN